jgi:hypothetical protein
MSYVRGPTSFQLLSNKIRAMGSMKLYKYQAMNVRPPAICGSYNRPRFLKSGDWSGLESCRSAVLIGRACCRRPAAMRAGEPASNVRSESVCLRQ